MNIRICALRLLLLAAIAMLACSTEDASSIDPSLTACGPGEVPLPSDGCRPAGLPPDMPPCGAGATQLPDGTCQKAGVPAEECGTGFASDMVGGCTPILPSQPCPGGMIAVPGDVECREVAPCTGGKWGNAPIEDSTQFVDGSYAGAFSDGTPDHPWRYIQQAIDNATPGAVVAVAPGRYEEDISIYQHPVRLWGKCPSQVEIASSSLITVDINIGESEIHNVAISGPHIGVYSLDAPGVMLANVWIHDTGDSGVVVVDASGDWVTDDMLITDSLIERCSIDGILASGAEVEIGRSAIIDTTPSDAPSGATSGIALAASPGEVASDGSTIRLDQSLIERSTQYAVFALGSDIRISSSVIRDTYRGTSSDPEVPPMSIGIASRSRMDTVGGNTAIISSVVSGNNDIAIESFGGGQLVIRHSTIKDNGSAIMAKADTETLFTRVGIYNSTIESNHGTGLITSDAEVNVTGVIVRNQHDSTLSLGTLGDGLYIRSTRSSPPAMIASSIIDSNDGAGIVLHGASADVSATIVRRSGANGHDGHGISIYSMPFPAERAKLNLSTSVIEDNSDGIIAIGADVVAESTLIRRSMERPGVVSTAGHAIAADADPDGNQPSSIAVINCLLDANMGGLGIASGQLTIDGTAINDTKGEPIYGLGPAITLGSTNSRAVATITRSTVDRSMGIGISSMNSDVTAELLLVRDTRPVLVDPQLGRRGFGGYGMHIDGFGHTALRSSRLQGNSGAGLIAFSGADLQLDGIVVADTLPSPLHRRFGDGIALVSDLFPVTAEIKNTSVTSSARAGISNFGGTAVISNVSLICNTFSLEGAEHDGSGFSYDRTGQITCSCGGKSSECAVETSGLEPPSRIH